MLLPVCTPPFGLLPHHDLHLIQSKPLIFSWYLSVYSASFTYSPYSQRFTSNSLLMLCIDPGIPNAEAFWRLGPSRASWLCDWLALGSSSAYAALSGRIRVGGGVSSSRPYGLRVRVEALSRSTRANLPYYRFVFQMVQLNGATHRVSQFIRYTRTTRRLIVTM